jgi:hypothetical protein
LFARGEYIAAAEAWTTAERAAGAAPNPTLARAQALNSRGASVLLGGVDRGRGSAGEVRERAVAVRDDLDEARRLLRGVAVEGEGDLPPDMARQLYAETLAWQTAFEAKIRTDSITIPTKDENAREFEYSAVNGDRLCEVRFNTDPSPVFIPGGASGNMGVTIVEFELDDRGRTTGQSVAASVPPNGAYAQAISEVVEHWFASTSGGRRCVMPKRAYWTGSFVVN